MSATQPASLTELKSWCKRRLGYPVIDINVDDDQVNDRVQEAVEYYQTFMGGGTRRMYLKHKMTQADRDRGKVNTSETVTETTNTPSSTLPGGAASSATTITLADATQFPASGSVIISKGEGNAETKAYSAKSGNDLTITALSNTHGAGATIALSVDSKWEQGQTYIVMPDGVESVLRILPFNNRGNLNMFDIRYQLRLNDLYDFSDVSVIYYQQVMWQLDLLDMLLEGERPIEFNVNQDRLYINMSWDDDFNIGDYILVECFRKINPTEFTQMYNDIWLKRYATSLIKRQWGENLIKFQGVTMLGGVTMNGETIFNEAKEEIATMEEQGRLTFETPVDFDIG